MKQNKEKSIASRYFIDHTANPALPERIRRVSFRACIRPFSILPRTSWKNSLARPEKVYTQWVGLDGIWILSQITQNPFQLARNTNIVLRTTLSRLWLAMQAANYRGNYWQSYIKGSLSLEVSSFVLVEFRLEFIVNLPRRKTRFWFINHGSRRSSLSEGGLFSVRYQLGLLFKQISSYSDQDKLKFAENVWKRLTRWAIWLPSVSGMFEFYPSFCVELAEKIS